jgi:nucleoside-diphosphate-sugar epimerase
VLLTGAGGFVGAAISQHWQASDLELTTCDLRGATRSLDVLDPQALDSLMLEIKPHAVIHAAAITTSDNDLRLLEVNVRGTLHVLDAANRHGVEHLVLLSSSGVYAPVNEPINEHSPTSSASAYALSKLLAEDICTVGKHSALSVWLLRLGPIYGAGERASQTRSKTSLVHLIAQAIQNQQAVTLPRAITDVYNWLHTKDLARLLESIVRRPSDGSVHLYNVAGAPSTGSELIAAFQAAAPEIDLQTLLEWTALPPPRHGALDCSRIQQELGWTPQVPLSTGILECLKVTT